MLRARIFPCLLLSGQGLVKTVRFNDPQYIGDPINAVRIFNTKEVHELVLLDITAGREGRTIPVDLFGRIAEECNMPLSVGGGIRTVADIMQLLRLGADKVVINTQAVENPEFISQAAAATGSQAIIVSIDVKNLPNGQREVMTRCGQFRTGKDPVEVAQLAEKYGAGEIFLNSIDRDGTMMGFDGELIKEVVSAVSIPVIVCGGAGKLDDFKTAVAQGAAAVSAGSFFVFQGKFRAVLINFPTKQELEWICD